MKAFSFGASLPEIHGFTILQNTRICVPLLFKTQQIKHVEAIYRKLLKKGSEYLELAYLVIFYT